ncbi:MAG TPA: ATP-binding protein [Rubrobacteraceae bacterium]|nr:ATP-binding protein [Rubrobacteraceae bacterium]
MTTLEDLRGVPLFKGMTDEQLRVVLGEGSEEFVPAGEVGGREGEPVEYLYVILEGEFRWSKKVDGGEVVMNTYGSGEFFAEVPLLLGKPFLATWRALADSRVFALPNDTFRRLLAADPSFSNAILEMLAQRIQVLYSVAQQRERLGSLGTMAAGLAHELNNPAAASRRATERLREGSENLRLVGMRLARASARGEIDPAQLDALERVVREALGRDRTTALDTLRRSEREEEVGLWLEDRGVEEAWDLSPTLVGAGLDISDLELLKGSVPPGAFADALRYLEAALGVAGLVDEVEESSTRISQLVATMEGYSYMDRAPTQEVDVNEGLENTLAILGYKLEAIEVERDYDESLPRITAHGSELNQVWTNLIDNAIDAVADGDKIGRIGLRTTHERDRLLVEISDNGPGIPEEIRDRIFEPFFTTKDVGEGAGLGLDVSYRIVVGRHGGDIRVVSKPGDTRFQVRLPMDGSAVKGPNGR